MTESGARGAGTWWKGTGCCPTWRQATSSPPPRRVTAAAAPRAKCRILCRRTRRGEQLSLSLPRALSPLPPHPPHVLQPRPAGPRRRRRQGAPRAACNAPARCSRPHAAVDPRAALEADSTPEVRTHLPQRRIEVRTHLPQRRIEVRTHLPQRRIVCRTLEGVWTGQYLLGCTHTC
jgi:hypothetical protein